MQLSSVKEILLIGFYQQSKEMARFILDMQKKHNLSIRLLNPQALMLKYHCHNNNDYNNMYYYRYLQEYCPLGTGGGIYHFRDQILRGNPRAFFVLHSDVCCTFPIVEMEEFQNVKQGFVVLGSEVSWNYDYYVSASMCCSIYQCVIMNHN